MRRALLLLFFAGLLIPPALVAQPAVKTTAGIVPDAAAANPQDPFVRGLIRLDERLRMQREAEDLARRALELKKRAERKAAGEPVDGDGLAIPAPISDPDFFTAFAARKYRLDGLVLSRPEREPVIHVYEERLKLPARVLFWSGKERRWVYRRGENETLAAVAQKLVMQVDDVLAMNAVARAAQLGDPMRVYVSPRDNGPLTHIIRRGDTLAGLAKIYDTDAARLRVRNKLDDKARLVIGRRLLIREKAIDARLARMAVAAPPPIDASKLVRARRPYARLGQFATEQEAMRGAREFYAKYYDFMDSDIALRLERDAREGENRFYNMDIGPLRSMRHGEAFCALFRADALPCLVVARVPGPERVRNFDSHAIISVTPYVYFNDADEPESGRTDVEKLTKLEYFLTEGQELGNAEGTIAKITANRIMVTDANGYLLTLPLHKIPEIDPIEKAKRAAAARQEAIDQAVAAGAAATGAQGGAQGAAAPEGDEKGVAQRLKEGETKRRAGSVDALNKVLGTQIE